MWFPTCKQYGMSEEQFWRSNPRIIKVWEKAWREEQNRVNAMTHAYVGNYILNAIEVGLSQILTPMFGKKQSNARYVEEPFRIFPKTEEEKEAEYEAMTQAFINWGNSLGNRFKKT